MKTILYLHGFLSSPASAKVRMLIDAVGNSAEVQAPDLNLAPAEVDHTVRRTIRALGELGHDVTVVGSSLGGFFAARAAAEFGLRAVLLNPCLNPWERVPEWVGHREIFGTTRYFDVLPSFATDFQILNRQLSPLQADGQKTLVVLSTADEVLSWRCAASAFGHSRQLILPGEDHRISGFETIVPRILDFCWI